MRRLYENTARDLPMAICVALRQHRPLVLVSLDVARSLMPPISARPAVAHPSHRMVISTWYAPCSQDVGRRGGSGGITWVRICGMAAVIYRLVRVTCARSARGAHGVHVATRTQSLICIYGWREVARASACDSAILAVCTTQTLSERIRSLLSASEHAEPQFSSELIIHISSVYVMVLGAYSSATLALQHEEQRAPIFRDLLICSQPFQPLSYVPISVRMGRHRN